MQFVKYILLLTTFATYFVTLSCTKPNPDTPDEDYNALFPFGGIDKPVVSYDEQNIRHCDPQLTKTIPLPRRRNHRSCARIRANANMHL